MVHEEEVEKLLSALTIQPNFLDQIRDGQSEDVKLQQVKAKLQEGKAEGFEIHEDEVYATRVGGVYRKNVRLEAKYNE